MITRVGFCRGGNILSGLHSNHSANATCIRIKKGFAIKY
jgi:hypothetical protein